MAHARKGVDFRFFGQDILDTVQGQKEDGEKKQEVGPKQLKQRTLASNRSIIVSSISCLEW